MRRPPAPTIALSVVAALATPPDAAARAARLPAAASDIDRTLMRMAEADGLVPPGRARGRPPATSLPPFTRERVAAPPFTGWGYGGTIPGAWPGF